MVSLLRLFQRETESGNRSSSMIDGTLGPTDNGRTMAVDPWRVVIDFASRSKEELRNSFRWLCLFATSGVDIPVATYLHFSSSAERFGICLTDTLWLVEAALRSTWLKSMGRQHLQAMFSSLHSHLASEVLHCLQNKTGLPEV
jgi:hypothetical protein